MNNTSFDKTEKCFPALSFISLAICLSLCSESCPFSPLYILMPTHTHTHNQTHTHRQSHTLSLTHSAATARGQLFSLFLQRSVSHRNPFLPGFRQPLFVGCRVRLLLYPLECVISVPVSRHQHFCAVPLLLVRIRSPDKMSHSMLIMFGLTESSS